MDQREDQAPEEQPDEETDRLLAELGHLLEAGDAGAGELDELATERLRQGKLSPDERQTLLEHLARDADARQAWVEKARPAIGPQLAEKVTRAVLEQRRVEGLPTTGVRRARTVAWIALAAGVALALLLGPRLLMRPGPVPPTYSARFSGDLQEFRGGDEYAAEVPTYAAASTLQVSLQPDTTHDEEVALAVAAIDPLGDAVMLAPLQVEQRNNVFSVSGDAGALFGNEAGTWRLVFVFSPAGGEPAQRWILRRSWEIKAQPDGTQQWPGNRQVLIRSMVYEP